MSVLELAFKLLNHTEDHTYLNPIDIATVIDLIEILVKTQVSCTQLLNKKYSVNQRFLL